MTLLHCMVYTFFSRIIWKLTNKHQPLQVFQPHLWLSGSWAFGRFGHSNLRGLAPGRKIATWKIECNGTRWIWGTGSTSKGLMLQCTWHGREVRGDRHRCFKTKSWLFMTTGWFGVSPWQLFDDPTAMAKVPPVSVATIKATRCWRWIYVCPSLSFVEIDHSSLNNDGWRMTLTWCPKLDDPIWRNV